MIHINLLPVREIKRKKKAKKQFVAMIVAFLFVLAALAAFAVYQKNLISQQQETLADTKLELAKYTAILKKMKKLEEEIQTLENQISVINKLKSSSSLTVHALDEIASLTPSKRIWLTSFSQTGNSVQISGMALDNRTIAKYMDDLKGSPYITGVVLASSSLRAYAGRDLKAFSISCSLTAVPEKQERLEKQN